MYILVPDASVRVIVIFAPSSIFRSLTMPRSKILSRLYATNVNSALLSSPENFYFLLTISIWSKPSYVYFLRYEISAAKRFVFATMSISIDFQSANRNFPPMLFFFFSYSFYFVYRAEMKHNDDFNSPSIPPDDTDVFLLENSKVRTVRIKPNKCSIFSSLWLEIKWIRRDGKWLLI